MPANAIPCPISNHFENCSKFEQSFPKMMTRGRRWSRKTSTGWASAPEPGWSKSREEPWRATSSVVPPARSNRKLRGENRVDTIFRAGPECPALFLCRLACDVRWRSIVLLAPVASTIAQANTLRARHIAFMAASVRSFRLRPESDSMRSSDWIRSRANSPSPVTAAAHRVSALATNCSRNHASVGRTRAVFNFVRIE